MPIRLTLFMLPMFSLGLICELIAKIHDFSKGPLKPGPIKTAFKLMISWGSYISMLIGGVIFRQEHIDFDYSAYLGPNYKKSFRRDVHTSTVVSNHVTCLDAWIIAQLGRFSVISAAENNSFPIMGSVCKVLHALMIDRAASTDAKERIVQSIIDRQNSIE
jgi:hypothetical protein